MKIILSCQKIFQFHFPDFVMAKKIKDKNLIRLQLKLSYDKDPAHEKRT